MVSLVVVFVRSFGRISVNVTGIVFFFSHFVKGSIRDRRSSSSLAIHPYIILRVLFLSSLTTLTHVDRLYRLYKHANGNIGHCAKRKEIMVLVFLSNLLSCDRIGGFITVVSTIQHNSEPVPSRMIFTTHLLKLDKKYIFISHFRLGT